MEVQKTEKNASVDGRNVILDIFAVDADGKNYDIEIQRADYGAGTLCVGSDAANGTLSEVGRDGSFAPLVGRSAG